MSPDEIAYLHDLSLAQVHAALSYAFANIEEIQASIQEADALVKEMEAEARKHEPD
jgi:uncharacterized protein (DUF433 family)